jgi:putative PIN family toxin of toxin-antitoxin system
MIRAVVDVNVLVSAIIGPLGHPRQVLLAWEVARFSAITSAGIITQMEAKLSLARIRRRFHLDTPATVYWVQALLRTQAERILVPIEQQLLITGDPEDDYVLATGRLAGADYLVTGDKGLLALGDYAGMQIVNPRQFLARLESVEAGTGN